MSTAVVTAWNPPADAPHTCEAAAGRRFLPQRGPVTRDGRQIGTARSVLSLEFGGAVDADAGTVVDPTGCAVVTVPDSAGCAALVVVVTVPET